MRRVNQRRTSWARRELKALLHTHIWQSVPCVRGPNGTVFYYRRDQHYTAWRVIWDRQDEHWFLHISIN